MDTKELRIGNYVNYYLEPPISENELVKLTLYDFINIDFGWRNYNPIPLTEEWLIKFGWGVSEFDNEMINNMSLKDTIIGYNYKSKVLELEGETESLYFNHIKHVHQLQNLHFALTGKELTIKN